MKELRELLPDTWLSDGVAEPTTPGHVMAVGGVPEVVIDTSDLHERLMELNRKQRRGVIARAKKAQKKAGKK